MSASSEPSESARAGNPAGRIALVLGILVVAAQGAQAALAQLAPLLQVNLQLSARDLDARLFPGLQVAVGVLAVLAVIAGAVGLGRRGRPRGAAAAGVALGAQALVVLVAALVAQAIYRAAL